MERGLTKSNKCGILELNMFDNFIYTILDKIVSWCERYKEYRIKKSLPKSAYSKEELKKWVSDNEKSYK